MCLTATHDELTGCQVRRIPPDSDPSPIPIPTLVEVFRPFLALLASDGALHMREVRARLEAKSGLSPDELAQRLPSGQFTVVENRIGWARTYLFKAGLIKRVARAIYQITDAGRRVLAAYPRGHRCVMNQRSEFDVVVLCARRGIRARDKRCVPIDDDDIRVADSRARSRDNDSRTR